MSIAGGCECGLTKYTLAGEARVHIYACHCLNCQTRSGSAFAEHAMVHGSIFVCEGPTVAHVRVANNIQFEEVFCGTCYTRIFNRNSALPDMIFLRAGTLFDSQGLEPVAHIWTTRKQHWVSLPTDIPAFEESPTAEQFGAAIQEAQYRVSQTS